MINKTCGTHMTNSELMEEDIKRTFLKKNLLFWKDSVMKGERRQRKRCLLSIGSLPKGPQWLRLGWAEVHPTWMSGAQILGPSPAASQGHY